MNQTHLLHNLLSVPSVLFHIGKLVLLGVIFPSLIGKVQVFSVITVTIPASAEVVCSSTKQLFTKTLTWCLLPAVSLMLPMMSLLIMFLLRWLTIFLLVKKALMLFTMESGQLL